MYKFEARQTILPQDFFLTFGGKLNPENQWCKLAGLINWGILEDQYIDNFKDVNIGQKALSVRVAVGSLIIQNKKTLSDRETVQEITENPYMQYFIGLEAFTEKAPFDPSMMVHFRKRLDKDIINEINEMIANPDRDDSDKKPPNDKGTPAGKLDTTEITNGPQINQGKLLLDATCVPADIHYPTDIWLLNNVRESLEEIIDVLHFPHIGDRNKPRTYRETAHKDFLNFAKSKRPNGKKIRKATGQQLRYIRRDFKIIDELIKISPLELLDRRQYQNLLVSREIYRQQLQMYRNKNHSVEDRIVSLHMPFIRPIVRGKTNATVEFGAKLAIGVVNGYSFMEHLSFDNFNEGVTLKASVENFKQRFGHYPEAVIADKIYRNRQNIAYCKERGIRLSGPPLGRPVKDAELRRQQYHQEREDSSIRNAVEGKFGEGKRFYGLNRIMTRLQSTSETVIAMQLLVMNLEKRLRSLFVQIFKVQLKRYFLLDNYEIYGNSVADFN
jgi:IS5 family transposase